MTETFELSAADLAGLSRVTVTRYDSDGQARIALYYDTPEQVEGVAERHALPVKAQSQDCAGLPMRTALISGDRGGLHIFAIGARALTADEVLAVIVADAEAIERALHKRRLRNLGLRTDAEVEAAIAEVRAEAAERSLTVAQVAAYDYDDNAPAFRRRMHAALWRSCQIHHAEGEYPALTRAAAIENGGNR